MIDAFCQVAVSRECFFFRAGRQVMINLINMRLNEKTSGLSMILRSNLNILWEFI